MDKNDVIEYVMNTPHNTNKAVLSSMLNQLTEGGGGGSSDFSTATVTVNYVGDYSASGISSGYVNIFTDVEWDSAAIAFTYWDDPSGYLPVSALGTVNELKIPIYNGAKSDISEIRFFGGNSEGSGTMRMYLADSADSSVVSGSAEIIYTDAGTKLFVWGDCVVNLELVYED